MAILTGKQPMSREEVALALLETAAGVTGPGTEAMVLVASAVVHALLAVAGAITEGFNEAEVAHRLGQESPFGGSK